MLASACCWIAVWCSHMSASALVCSVLLLKRSVLFTHVGVSVSVPNVAVEARSIVHTCRYQCTTLLRLFETDMASHKKIIIWNKTHQSGSGCGPTYIWTNLDSDQIGWERDAAVIVILTTVVQINFDETNALGVHKPTRFVCHTEAFRTSHDMSRRYRWPPKLVVVQKVHSVVLF